MAGAASLFAGKEAAEHAWRIVEGVLDDATPVRLYEAGSWGPAEASAIAPEGGWVNPA